MSKYFDFSNLKCTHSNVKQIKNKSNDSISDDTWVRLHYESVKPMNIEYMNEAIKNILKQYYPSFNKDKYKNKLIEFNFCTKNDYSFGITDWIKINPKNIDEIEDLDINKTFQLYDGDEKTFDELTERYKFWLTFRIKNLIGYGLTNHNIESPNEEFNKYCFFKALRKANIIGTQKKKYDLPNGESILRYDPNIEDTFKKIITEIKNKNKNHKEYKRNNKIIYIDDEGGVCVDDMPKWETYFQCNIYINAYNNNNIQYISKNKFNRSVYLIFNDGHFANEESKSKTYDLDTEHYKFKIFNDTNKLYNNNNQLLIINHNLYYDGNEFIKNPTNEQIKKLKKNKHIINYEESKKMFNNEDFENCLTIESKIKKVYELYKKCADELKEIGNIDVLKCYSLQKQIFFDMYMNNKYLNLNCEPVCDFMEYHTLNKGKTGGYSYVYKINEPFKNVYSYDVKSAYPAALVHLDFKIPIKTGEFMNMSDYFNDNLKRGKLRYGLYKCKIENKENNENKRFSDFRFNKDNIYSHFDILLAKEFGFSIELLNENIYPFMQNKSGKPLNALIYSADKLIDSNLVFGPIVQRYYKIKQKTNNPLIKKLLSGMWGFLCDDKTYKKKKDIKNIKGTYTVELEENEELLQVLPSKNDDNNIDAIYKDRENITRTALFRLKPFLLAFQRSLIYEDIKAAEKEGARILKVKTDGIYTDKEIKKFEENKWHYEIIDGVKVKKSNKIIEGTIIRDNFYDHIMFLNQTRTLTDIKEIEEFQNDLKLKKINSNNNN